MCSGRVIHDYTHYNGSRSHCTSRWVEDFHDLFSFSFLLQEELLYRRRWFWFRIKDINESARKLEVFWIIFWLLRLWSFLLWLFLRRFLIWLFGWPLIWLVHCRLRFGWLLDFSLFWHFTSVMLDICLYRPTTRLWHYLSWGLFEWLHGTYNHSKYFSI